MASRTLYEKIVPYVYLGSGGCVAVALLYPYTYGLDYYKQLLAIHSKDGQELPVDKEVIKMADEIQVQYGWPKNQLEQLEKIFFFPSSSAEFCHLGTAKSHWGGHIGIPKYYLKQFKEDDAQFDDLLKEMNIESSSPTAKSIKQSFNISEDAKRFALAREIRLSKSYELYYVTAGIPLSIANFYLTPNIISSMLPFRGVRMLSFLSLIPLTYFGCSYIVRESSRFINRNADKAAVNISEGVARGGLEYLQALQTRQKLLEDNEDKSNNTKSKRGDDNLQTHIMSYVQQSWKDSFMTLEERISNLREILVQYENKSDK